MSPEFVRARPSQELEKALRSMMTSRVFPKGTVLYRQGMAATGLYLLEKGLVRVSLSTVGDQNQLVEVAGPGALLGLSDSLTGGRYRVTVEAEEPTTAGFLERALLLSFLGSHQEFCMQVVRLLSDNLHVLYHKFRNVSSHPGRPRRRLLNEQMS